MESFLIGIGRKLRAIRKKKGLLLNDVAERANVTAGLISKIENGRTIPSLPVFLGLIEALEEDLSDFFRGLSNGSNQKYLVVRSDELSLLEKEEQVEGFSYELIFDKSLLSIGFEVVVLTLQPGAKREKTTTDAYEFKYVLEGEVVYYIGDDRVTLQKGDSLFFDARIPHLPANQAEQLAKMLVFYFYVDK